MSGTPYLIVNQLVIQGIDNRYSAKFKEGLNLVWGDMDSGKSSILNLIDYCLGGSNSELKYDEMMEKARIVFLEVNLNGNISTFERPVLQEKALIKIFSCPYNDIGNHYPKLVSANSINNAPDGWISDHILDGLGIPKVKIKESIYRDDANSDRLSFRDLMKLLYLKQKQIGTDSILNYGNTFVFKKNIEIQKFVFNIYNDKLSSLREELGKEATTLKKLRENQISIKEFLEKIKLDFDMGGNELNLINEKELIAKKLTKDITILKKNFDSTAQFSIIATNEILKLKSSLADLINEKRAVTTKINNYLKLRATYQLDIENLKVSQQTREILGHHKCSPSETLECPLCKNTVQLNSHLISNENISYEIKSIKNRFDGVTKAIFSLQERVSDISTEIDTITGNLSKLTRDFDSENISKISPLVYSISLIENQRMEIEKEIISEKRNISIKNKFAENEKNIIIKAELVDKIKEAIKKIESNTIDTDEVVSELTDTLNSYLIRSGLQKADRIYFDDKFVPHFRGITYYNLSSGGVRTITSIAWYVSRLIYTINNNCNLPTFLMLDTPGQNIGRNKRDEDTELSLSDPKLYDNIYKQIQETIEFATSEDKKCQVIIVDNDLPSLLKKYGNFHLVKHFLKNRDGYEKGLITDA